MEVILKLAIMGVLAGFSGVKLFSKNKRNEKALICGCITSIAVIIIHFILV